MMKQKEAKFVCSCACIALLAVVMKTALSGTVIHAVQQCHSKPSWLSHMSNERYGEFLGDLDGQDRFSIVPCYDGKVRAIVL